MYSTDDLLFLEALPQKAVLRVEVPERSAQPACGVHGLLVGDDREQGQRLGSRAHRHDVERPRRPAGVDPHLSRRRAEDGDMDPLRHAV